MTIWQLAITPLWTPDPLSFLLSTVSHAGPAEVQAKGNLIRSSGPMPHPMQVAHTTSASWLADWYVPALLAAQDKSLIAVSHPKNNSSPYSPHADIFELHSDRTSRAIYISSMSGDVVGPAGSLGGHLAFCTFTQRPEPSQLLAQVRGRVLALSRWGQRKRHCPFPAANRLSTAPYDLTSQLGATGRLGSPARPPLSACRGAIPGRAVAGAGACPGKDPFEEGACVAHVENPELTLVGPHIPRVLDPLR